MTTEGYAGEHKFNYDHIPANDLHIDPRVQRPVSNTQVARIVANFSEEALGVIIVSARRSLIMGAPGEVDEAVRYIVLDGQTRLLAVRAIAGTDDTTIRMHARVYHNLTREEEAKLFLTLNDRVSVNPLAKYNVSLVAGEQWALDIHHIADRYGFEVSVNAPIQRRFTAVGCARTILNREGGLDALDRTFDTITRAWGHQRKAASAETVSGLGLLYLRHNGKVDHRGLVAHMKEDGDAAEFCGVVKQRMRAMRVSLAEASYHRLVQLHDKSKKTGSSRKLGKELG